MTVAARIALDLCLNASQEIAIGLASDDGRLHRCLVGGTRPSYHRTVFDRSGGDDCHDCLSVDDGCYAGGDSCATASGDRRHDCCDGVRLSQSFAIDANGVTNGDYYDCPRHRRITEIRNLRYCPSDDGFDGGDGGSRPGYPRSFRDRVGS